MKMLAAAALTLLLSACASQDHAPLLFGQAHTLGISVGASPANQTPEMTLGFKDVNIAVIPTVGGNLPDGLIQGTTSKDYDAYSTFGQFEASGKATEVQLGKFFATGIAARRLADGFGCKVSNGRASGCDGKGPAPTQ